MRPGAKDNLRLGPARPAPPLPCPTKIHKYVESGLKQKTITCEWASNTSFAIIKLCKLIRASYGFFVNNYFYMKKIDERSQIPTKIIRSLYKGKRQKKSYFLYGRAIKASTRPPRA